MAIETNDLDKFRDYDAFFKETWNLFEDVTSYAVVLETIGGGKVEVTAINELRGVLFHLYNFISKPDLEKTPDFFINNYYNAKDHLHRAYFDIFTMLYSFISLNIYEYSNKYDLTIINQYYPKYFTNITPELTMISQFMAKIRSDRENKVRANESDILSTKNFITIMLDWYRELQSMTSVFIAAQEKADTDKRATKRKEKLDLALKIVVPILALILGFLLNYFFIKK